MFRAASRNLLASRTFVSTPRVRQVQEILDLKQYRELIKPEKLTVVDFYATWCGPCRAIEPFVKDLSEKVPEVSFARVDVDQVQDVAVENGITAMPTIVYYKGGQPVEKVVGADIRRIAKLVEELK